MMLVWLLGIALGAAAGAATAIMLLPQSSPLAQGVSLADEWGMSRPLLDR